MLENAQEVVSSNGLAPTTSGLGCRGPGVKKNQTRRCSPVKARAMCELQESVDMNEVARMRSIDVDPSPHGAQRGIMDCSVAAHSC